MGRDTLIRFYKGPKAGMPVLEEGEPGYCTDTKELFIGTANGNILVGGGISAGSSVTPAVNATPKAFPDVPVFDSRWLSGKSLTSSAIYFGIIQSPYAWGYYNGALYRTPLPGNPGNVVSVNLPTGDAQAVCYYGGKLFAFTTSTTDTLIHTYSWDGATLTTLSSVSKPGLSMSIRGSFIDSTNGYITLCVGTGYANTSHYLMTYEVEGNFFTYGSLALPSGWSAGLNFVSCRGVPVVNGQAIAISTYPMAGYNDNYRAVTLNINARTVAAVAANQFFPNADSSSLTLAYQCGLAEGKSSIVETVATDNGHRTRFIINQTDGSVQLLNTIQSSSVSVSGSGSGFVVVGGYLQKIIEP